MSAMATRSRTAAAELSARRSEAACVSDWALLPDAFLRLLGARVSGASRGVSRLVCASWSLEVGHGFKWLRPMHWRRAIVVSFTGLECLVLGPHVRGLCVSDLAGLPRLRELHLGSAVLASLPLSCWRSLEVLAVRSSRIDPGDDLTAFFASATGLRSLSLGVVTGPRAVGMEELTSLTALTSLSMDMEPYFNFGGVDALANVPAIVGAIPSLVGLLELRCGYLSDGDSTLRDALAALPALTSLDISDSGARIQSLDALSALRALTRLDLGSCAASSLVPLGALRASLRELTVTQSSADLGPVYELAGLERLSLGGWHVPLGVSTLLRDVSRLTALTDLDLGRCGGRLGTSLAPLIALAPHLRRLDVGGTQLGMPAEELLAPLTRLEALKIDAKPGAWMRAVPALRVLDIGDLDDWMRFGEHDSLSFAAWCRAAGDHLERCGALKCLAIRHLHDAPSLLVDHLVRAMEATPTLASLDVSHWRGKRLPRHVLERLARMPQLLKLRAHAMLFDCDAVRTPDEIQRHVDCILK